MLRYSTCLTIITVKHRNSCSSGNVMYLHCVQQSGVQHVGGRLEVASVGRQSSDMMTWLVMALNCATVARMVGDMFSFLLLCDHTQPKHWYGTTLTNRA
ncbi:hypothetical protein EYF80_048517 [Liparis tanakae]|uniref:Uncharacterized protein n=1 Tax=Liparis tanakae TaxID=230148 RepID=A0A4Z2FKN4_9TELE|nr:hypothetical protein EYF80_048517 [Liparis tanakae]